MLGSGENNASEGTSGGNAAVSGFFQSAEIMLDLLKNTPSNIAKLEDVIDHCEGRHKYLARTQSPSDGENVRWYFCKVPLAQEVLAASVPKTEIVGKNDYFRFSVRDSLALEAYFLQREEEILSHWWKEYAECSAGPSESVSPKVSSDGLYTIEEERVGVPVKGGLYEVDLIRRYCFPVYWSGENRRILRGHWFARKGGLDWLPLREDIAEPLEFAYQCQIWHRRTFQPSGLFAARVNIQGTTQGLHALFTGEDDTWEAWLVTDTSDFSLSMGRGNRFRLRRGFSSSGSLRPTQDELRQKKEEEMDDYCSQVPVRHVVFMVHGIGQSLLKANLVDDVGNFRHITASLAERHLSPYQRSTQRVLYIPCQWRKGLQLSGESAVENITLDGVHGLRVTLSATVHDVLYYMSPIYCQDIINSVSNQLNKLYQKFLKRNPGYDGKVSIYGHSLGSVLSYDILCHQENLIAPYPMISEYDIEDRDSQSHMDADKHVQVSGCNQNNEHSEDKIDDENTCSSVSNPSSMNFEDSTNEQSVVTESSTSSNVDEASSSNGGKQVSSTSVSGKYSQKDGLDLECETYPELVKDEIDSTLTNASLYDDAQEVAVVRNDDDLDKDKLIALLKKKVESLKDCISKLKQEDKSTSMKMQNICNFDSIKETKEDEATGSQSLSTKHTPDQDCSKKSYTPYIKYTKLDFKVDTFFAVGSPLGVFLALRNMHIGNGGGQSYWKNERISEEIPACRQMFNIFHPFDPVAYRIEPLICKEYIGKRPALIPYYRGGKRLHIGFQEFTEDIAASSQAVFSNLNSMKVRMVDIFKSRNKNDVEEAPDESRVKERSYGSLMMERLTGSENGRVDHMLQDKTFQHSYISALGSHTNYWRDPDTALFILKHLYQDIPEESDTSEEQSNEGSSDSTSENRRKQVELFFQRAILEEDIPLTFSDKVVIREFTRKMRKSMN